MRVANDILIPELVRLIAEKKEVRFTPSGVSMRPFIEGDRDSVVLAAIQEPPRRGDIILANVAAYNGHTYVLHRLIRIENDTYVLQGDGNLFGKERCSREDLLARVIRIENARGQRKIMTRGYIWHALMPVRKWLLKIYRHTWLKWCYN